MSVASLDIWSPKEAGHTRSSRLLSRPEDASFVAKRKLPPIYVDEGSAPEVAKAFREEGFRVVETRRSRRFAGTDEMDYLPELRRDRAVFVTSDQRHIERMRAGRHKHPGVVFLDRQWDREAMVAQAGVIAETMKAATDVLGPTGFYNKVLEPALGGLYYTEGSEKKRVFMSWARYDEPLG